MIPRLDLSQKLRASGLLKASEDFSNLSKDFRAFYWDETSAYSFSKAEVNALIKRIKPIIKMSREAVDFLFHGEFGYLNLPKPLFRMMRESYQQSEIDFYTRYDFAYLPDGQIKLVNIQGEAPDYFLEAAQTQRVWMLEMFGDAVRKRQISQVNRLPELSIQGFQELYNKSEYGVIQAIGRNGMREQELASLAFMLGLAGIGGWITDSALVGQVHYDRIRNLWLTDRNDPVLAMYKQTGWINFFKTEAYQDILLHFNRFEFSLDPLWKVIVSNRAILAALSTLYPKSDILSKWQYKTPKGLGSNFLMTETNPWEMKSQIALLNGKMFYAYGEPKRVPKDKESLVFGKFDMPKFYEDSKTKEKKFVYLSAFTVGGHVAALGIREENKPILGKYSTFKPHYVTL